MDSFPTRAIHATTTYRLRGIPYHFDRLTVHATVESALNLKDDIQSQVKSLADSPFYFGQKEKIATLIFSSTPERLSSKDSEWTVEHVDYASENGTTINLIFDTHFHGFTPLHISNDAECDTDLIAVSGLGGHAFGSFKEKNGSFMWLRDCLPSDLPGVRIFVYGHDSSLAKSDSFQTTLDLGKQLQSSIHAIRGHHINRKQDSRPIRQLLLIGHSLGGVLIKQALIEMSRDKDASHQTNLKSTCGIMFFGVPSQGMDIKSLIPMIGYDQPNRSLLESLGTASAVLRDQGREFRELFNREDLKIISFYETKLSPTAKEVSKGQWKMQGPPATLVDTYSATMHRWKEDTNIPINRTHSEIVKFKSRHDEYYIQALNHLTRSRDNAIAVLDARLSDESPRAALNLDSDQLDCLRSLAFEEQESRWHKISTIDDDSCDWSLQHKHYVSWLQQDQGLLWIRGKPGAGKSTLIKCLVSSRESRRLPGKIIVSFFFNGRGAEIEKSPLGMFRSLLHQLLSLAKFHSQLVKLSSKFENRCRTKGDYGTKWNWAIDELREVLSECVLEASKQQSIRVFVDALDESGDVNANKLVKWFKSLILRARSRKVQLQICFSCRHFPIITWLDHEGLAINVENENQSAIRNFTKAELTGIFEGSNLQELLDLVVGKSSGVFQWVALVVPKLQALRRRGKNFKHIYTILQAIPSDLSRLYEALLQQVNDEDRDQSIKLLQWICFALRPLKLQELQHAVAIDLEKVYKCVSDYGNSDEFSDENDMERRIIDLSKGLAEVTDTRHGRTVQFIHQSVGDYLVTTGLETLGSISPGNSVVCAGHFRLSRTCIRYLSLRDRHQWVEQDIKIACRAYPLLEYAATSWTTHCEVVEKYRVVQDDLLQALGWRVDDIFQCWLQILNAFELFTYLRYDTEATLLHVASWVGLTSLAGALLEKDSIISELGDSRARTPLHLAAESGHIEIMELLWQDGVVTNLKDIWGQTALHLAASKGCIKVVELLLRQSSIMVNEKDKYGRTPLYCAAMRDHTEVVELLLRQSGVMVNEKDEHGKTPLHYAVMNDCSTIVELLLRQNGISVNEKDNYGQTPLHCAAILSYNGYTKIVELLLRQDGIMVDAKEEFGRTPLYRAWERGHAETVKLLEEAGARSWEPPATNLGYNGTESMDRNE